MGVAPNGVVRVVVRVGGVVLDSVVVVVVVVVVEVVDVVSVDASSVEVAVVVVVVGVVVVVVVVVAAVVVSGDVTLTNVSLGEVDWLAVCITATIIATITTTPRTPAAVMKPVDWCHGVSGRSSSLSSRCGTGTDPKAAVASPRRRTAPCGQGR